MMSHFGSGNKPNRLYLPTVYNLVFQKGPGKEKGRIELMCMKVIENVDDDELDGKRNVFQVRQSLFAVVW
jgi:hypothetical protein